MFVCGVLYNAGLWMDEFFGIIGIYLNKKCLCLEIIGISYLAIYGEFKLNYLLKKKL